MTKRFKPIYIAISGGRETAFKGEYEDLVYEAIKKLKIPEDRIVVLTGGAGGIDEGASIWAIDKSYKIAVFPAMWGIRGKAAGPIRNQQMADLAHVSFLFPGGRGTDDMFNRVTKRYEETNRPIVYDYRYLADD